MSALPAEDPLHPAAILRELPAREHETFLAQYREAVDQARDPARWPQLRRMLERWRGLATMAARPGFHEAQEAALAPWTGEGGMFLDDYARLRRGRP